MNLIGNWRIRKSAVDSETVYISEKFGVRSLHIGSDTVQSAMRIAKPNELEFLLETHLALIDLDREIRKVDPL